jgi:hypothetical protein
MTRPQGAGTGFGVFPAGVILAVIDFPDIRTGQPLICTIRAPFVRW